MIRHLRKTLDLSHPIKIRRVKMKENDGECKFLNGKFIIRINKSLPEFAAIDVALHEFAHAISWNKDKDMHGIQWGKAYSLVYRKFLEWNEKKINQ